MPRIAVLLVAVLCLGTACGGSDDPGASPSPSVGSPTESTSPSSEPTDSSTSSVAPATGPVLDMPLASVRVPDDWEVDDDIVSSQKDASDDDTSSLITLSETESFAGRPLPPAELVDIWYDVSPYSMQPKELPVAELDGVEAYHLAGKVQQLQYLEEFGASVDDMIVGLTFAFSTEVTPEERQEIVDSVVATFRWK